MGHRSDVGVAIKTEIYNNLSNESKEFLNTADEIYDHKEGKLFIFTSYKWYVRIYNYINNFYSELSSVSREDYLIIVTEGKDSGDWYDNPFELCKVTKLNYEKF